MGIGFTITLMIMGCIREILGAGTWMFGVAASSPRMDPMTVFITPPGGFFVFGCLMALVIWIEIQDDNRKGAARLRGLPPRPRVCGGKSADKAEGGEA